MFLILFCMHQEVELLDCMVTLFKFEELPNCFPKCLLHLILPPAVYEVSDTESL